MFSQHTTKVLLLTDTKGNALRVVVQRLSLGFKGAKKGTLFAAAKVGESWSGRRLAIWESKSIEAVVRGGRARERLHKCDLYCAHRPCGVKRHNARSSQNGPPNRRSQGEYSWCSFKFIFQ